MSYTGNSSTIPEHTKKKLKPRESPLMRAPPLCRRTILASRRAARSDHVVYGAEGPQGDPDTTRAEAGAIVRR